MDLIKISEFLSTTNLRTYRDDDYWVDRLCHRYSVVLFSIFAVLVTTKAYIGDPIDCWAPPEFKASYERYAETLCFVNGTYYISANDLDIPSDSAQRYSNRVRYYQWTPFILLLQAFSMYLPRVLWLSLNTKYGINLRNLVDAAKKYESVDSYSNKEKILIYICKNLLRTIQYNEYSNDKKYLSSSTKRNVYLNHKYELSKMLHQLSEEKLIQTNSSKIVLKQSKIKNSKLIENEAQVYSKLSSDQDQHSAKKPKRDHRSKYGDEADDDDDSKKKLKQRKSSSTVRKADKSAFFIIDPSLNASHLIDYLNRQNSTKHFKLELPLDLLQSKIKNISKKHLLNILASGYEVNGSKIVDNSNYNKNTHKPLAYLINNDLIKKFENFDNEIYELKSNKTDNSHIDKPLLKIKKTLVPNLSRTYLSFLYLLTKFIYLLVSVGQIFCLNRLIGNEFYMIGINLLRSFFYDIEWPHMAIFPRMTLCEIYIREIGTVHPYLIQCVLRINLFNEVIFVLVWYWLAFVCLVTGIDLTLRCLNLVFCCTNCQRKLFALKYLELIHLNTIKNSKGCVKRRNQLVYDRAENEGSGSDSGTTDSSCTNPSETEQEKEVNKVGDLSDLDERYVLIVASQDEEFELFERFCETNFNNDTVFALQVIEQNASSLIVSEIVEHLWLQFKFLNCIYSSETNDYLLKKFFILNRNRKN